MSLPGTTTTTTNDYAEYMGLLTGLRAALSYGWTRLEVIGDSESILRQTRDHRRLRTDASWIYLQARDTADRLDVRRWTHHLRAHNRMADTLANLAMDEVTALKCFIPRPVQVIALFATTWTTAYIHGTPTGFHVVTHFRPSSSSEQTTKLAPLGLASACLCPQYYCRLGSHTTMQSPLVALPADAGGLRAALDTFDELGLDSEFFGALVATERVDKTEEEEQKQPPHRRSAPKKRKKQDPKAEILRLRAELDDCQAVVDRCASSEATSGLQDAAKREMKLRLEGESENAKLRKIIESCVKESRRFVRLATRTLVAGQELGLLDALPCEDALQYHGPELSPHAQLRRLDLLGLLNRNSHSSLFDMGESKELREIEFKCLDSSNSDAIQVEGKMAWQVPFPVDDVAHSLWLHTARMSPKEAVYKYEEVHTEPGVIVSRIIAGPRDRSSGAAAHVQIATRLLPRAGGVRAVVCTAQGNMMHDAVCVGSNSGDSFITVEDVSPIPSRGSLSLIKWWRRVSGRPPPHITGDAQMRSEWVHSVVQMRPRVETALEQTQHALEDLLLAPRSKS